MVVFVAKCLMQHVCLFENYQKRTITEDLPVVSPLFDLPTLPLRVLGVTQTQLSAGLDYFLANVHKAFPVLTK